MKKTIFITLSILVIFVGAALLSVSLPRVRQLPVVMTSDVTDTAVGEEKTTSVDHYEEINISSRVLPYRDIDEIYSTCDYIVLAKVTSMSDSYLYNRTFDPYSDVPIAEQLRHLRTPYDVEIIEVYKGDTVESGDTLTVFTTGGTYAGYIVETSFPELEVGGTYILPVVDLGDNQNYVIRNPMAEVSDVSSDSRSAVLTSGSAEIIPSMFDSTWEGIDTISDLRDKIAEIEAGGE